MAAAVPPPTPTDAQVEAAQALLADHLGALTGEDWVQHVSHDPEIDRWYLRFGCDGRDAATIYLELRQRSLHHELYFLPAPPDDARRAELHLWLLRRNHQLRGTRFSVGPDGDVYLVGRTPIERLDHAELDRLVGVLYETTEQWFQAAVGIAYGKRGAAPRTGQPGP